MKQQLPYSSITGSHYVMKQLIKPNSQVLDIGCSTGIFGQFLKQEKNCTVHGIEINPDTIKIAENRLDKTFNIDVTRIKNEILNFKEYDYLIFGDILEHLENPKKILKKITDKIKPETKVIISIPNVANWLNRIKLLLGKWNYTDHGTLDRTHLRFYTLKTYKKLIISAHLSIKNIYATSGSHRIDKLFKLNNPANIWKNLLAFQFISLSSKAN